jgi:signal peptidase I
MDEERVLPPYLDRTNVTLTFPSYLELMDCAVGDCVISDTLVCGNSTFCVKLYPRGGGTHISGSPSTAITGKSTEQGFGMAYKALPMFGNQGKQNQRVGMYLQYLGNETVDVTFALRLKGNQQVGRRFDVEWRAGMRFVSPDSKTELGKGRANDFGAHLMQTPLLQEFMGISDEQLDDPILLAANVEVIVHDTIKEMTGQYGASPMDDEQPDDNAASVFGWLGKDIRVPEGSSTKEISHDGRRVRVGKIVVPILSKLSERPEMFRQGAYPGVEYRILRILDTHGQERFTSCPGCEYEMKPIYPLVSQLERPWPVRVSERDIPRLYTPNMYNAASAIGSLLTAVTGLLTAFLVSQAISLFFIPSRSMDPTLKIGDVLLVDKLSPRILNNRKTGDILLFSPPEELRDIVAANGGRLTSRDLFVKRLAAQAGDTVSVNAAGRVLINGKPATGRRDLCEAEPLRLIERYVKAKEQTLANDEYFLMGDCSSVSIDSRVWGSLKSSDIVGKPILRLWPLDRFGPLPSLQPLTTSETWLD